VAGLSRRECVAVKLIKKCGQVMATTTAYRLWQAPFVHAKMRPLLQNNDLRNVRRVLDVGCGPGVNCRYFAHTDYLGIDVNPNYIQYARRRYGREFLVQDACSFAAPSGPPFDFVLLNSLLHHLDDADTHRLMSNLGPLVDREGHVHIIELVMPKRGAVGRFLACHDRGDYARSWQQWEAIFAAHLRAVVCEPFTIRAMGVVLWNLVYFKGSVKRR